MGTANRSADITAGKRKTIQRQLILDAVRKLDMHATAEQVFDFVVAELPTVSKATVYRNLSQMAETGELVNIGNFGGSAHYDHNRHKHYHFTCDSCKRIFDINAHIPDLHAGIAGMDGHEIRGHSLNFSGLCRDCNVLVGP